MAKRSKAGTNGVHHMTLTAATRRFRELWGRTEFGGQTVVLWRRTAGKRVPVCAIVPVDPADYAEVAQDDIIDDEAAKL